MPDITEHKHVLSGSFLNNASLFQQAFFRLCSACYHFWLPVWWNYTWICLRMDGCCVQCRNISPVDKPSAQCLWALSSGCSTALALASCQIHQRVWKASVTSATEHYHRERSMMTAWYICSWGKHTVISSYQKMNISQTPDSLTFRLHSPIIPIQSVCIKAITYKLSSSSLCVFVCFNLLRYQTALVNKKCSFSLTASRGLFLWQD